MTHELLIDMGRLLNALGACPRIENLFQKSWICAIFSCFSSNSRAIFLKTSKNRPKSNFPSRRFLFSDKLLVSALILGLVFWQNYNSSIHSKPFVVAVVVLFVLSVCQSASEMEFKTVLVLFLLVVLALKIMRLSHQKPVKTHNNNAKSAIQSNAIIADAKEQERSRIYANLHGDVGAKLLELIYTAKDEDAKNLAKKVLGKMRQTIASTVNIQCTLQQLCDEIVDESTQHFKPVSIRRQHSMSLQNGSQRVAVNIIGVATRIISEVVSNILKHSKASQIEFRLHEQQGDFKIVISDNGIGFNANNLTGKGLKTIAKRAQSIEAEVVFEPQPKKGTRFELRYCNAHK